MNEERAENRGFTGTDHGTRLLLVATVCAIASLLVRQFLDADVFWQVAIGRDILANLAVPRIDTFAAAALGRSYHDSHWLFQVVLATADRLGGLTAVGAVPIVIWGIAFGCCYRSIRNWAAPTVSSLLIFIVSIACNFRFMPRPDIITCAMIALFYYLLQAGSYKTIKGLALFTCLQVIWSNAHGLFVIGPFMSGCYLLAALGRGNQRENNELLPLGRLLLLLLVASLCTPFAFNGWLYALQLAQEAGSSAHPIYLSLRELAPTFSSTMLVHPDFWCFFLLLCLLLSLTLFSLSAGQPIPVGRLLIVTAMLLAAASGRRNIPLFALAAAPLIAELAANTRIWLQRRTAATWTAATLLALFCWLPLSGRYYHWFEYEPLRFGIGVPAEYLPTGLPEFLRKINFTGQIYNTDLFGGFCLYHGILPLVDGRWEVYDMETLQRILSAPFDRTAWEWVVARYDIRGILLETGSADARSLVPHLLVEGNFQQIYTDNVSTFWVRTDQLHNN